MQNSYDGLMNDLIIELTISNRPKVWFSSALNVSFKTKELLGHTLLSAGHDQEVHLMQLARDPVVGRLLEQGLMILR